MVQYNRVGIPISNFSSVKRSPTMRPQQDFSRSFCSCCCPPLLSSSFLVPLGLLTLSISHYSPTLVVFLCVLFLQLLVRTALLPKDIKRRIGQASAMFGTMRRGRKEDTGGEDELA